MWPPSTSGSAHAARLCLVVAIAALLAAPAAGQSRRGSRGGADPLDLIRRQSVQDELKVTPEEAGKIEKARSSTTLSREQMQPYLEKMAAAPDEAARDIIRDEMRDAGRKQAEDQLREILGKERSARLDQLVLRELGPRGLLRDDVAAAVSLSNDQKAKLQEVADGYRAAREALGRRPDEEARQKLREEWDAKYLELLTPEQMTAWQKQLGPEVATAGKAETNGTANATAATSPGSTKAGEPTDPATQPAPADGTPSATTSPDQPQAPAVVSFAPASRPGSKPTPGKLSFNFRYAPWSDVLTLFAEAADLTLDLNQIPPGTFNYRDNQEYTPEEALDVLNGYLLPRGYILIKRNRFLAAVNIDDGIPPNLVPNVTIEELPTRGKNELLSVVIPLQGIEAVDAEKEVESLLGPQGKVSSLSAANSLVVTDIGSNLRRVHRLLQNVTAKSDPEELTFQSYSLRYIPATDAERITRSQLGLSPSSVPNVSASSSSSSSRYGSSRYGSSRDSRYSRSREPERPATATTSKTTQVTADPRTNRLLVTATAAQHGLVEEVIKAIDVSEDDSGRPYVATDNSPRLKVYHVQTADPREVTKTLDAIMPGVVVNEDGRARKIHILATPAEHQQVEELIRQLDGLGGSQTVTVIPLARLDPLAVAATLRSLFAGDGDSAPTVESDTYGRRLMVRGTSDQLTQIRAVLTQLGEDGSGSIAEDQRQRGNVRTFSLGGRDPQEFLPMLERIWSTTSSTPIRVVVPSRPSPIRDRLAPSRNDDRDDLRERPKPDAASQPSRSPSGVDAGDAEPAPRGPVGAQSPPQSSLLRRASLVTEKKTPEEAASSAANESDPDQTPADRGQASDPANAVPAEQPPSGNPENRGNDESPADDEKPAGSGPPVGVAVQGDQLIVTSSDPEVLDRMERLIESLSQAMPPQTRWTVFYLRSADATETSAMLEQLFPTSSVASVSDPNDTSLMGSLTGGISNFGQSVMDLAGLNSLGQSPQTLRIIPEVRSNSLFVAGPAQKVREVEDVLKILDATELPESLRERVPRMIPVEYADVDEVYEIVKSLYSDYMSDPNSGGRGGRGNPLQMLMGGGGGNNGNRNRQTPAIRLTLSVDNRTNQLLVSASDSLFRQIEELVGTLDQAAYEARQTVRIVTLDNANAYVVQQTLGSVLPKVHVSTTGTPQDRRRNESSRQANDNNNDDNSRGRDDAMRQLMEQRFREQIRQRFQRGGTNTNGGSARGGFPGARGRGGLGGSSDRGSSGRRGGGRDR